MARWTHGEQMGNIRPITKVYDRLPSPVRDKAGAALERVGLKAHLALLFDSPLRRRGWFSSFDEPPHDHTGEPLPWMSYPFIDFAEERLTTDMRVFEYGSGNSTAWFGRHVGEVAAVEHDPEWYNYVSQEVQGEDVSVIHRPRAEYAESIIEFDEFDVVVIDGIERVESTYAALDKLSETGVIVFDDVHREQYASAYDLLEEQSFNEIEFRGMGPTDQKLQNTSVFYRDANCFGI